MTDRLAGRKVLITGAAGGIGTATARRLCSEGAELLLADLNADAVQSLASELGQTGIGVDVTKSADIQRMVETAYQRWGRLDVLFNNAGIIQARPMLELSEADWDRMLAVNLKSVFFVLQAVAKRMIRQPVMEGSELRGKLIQTASIAAFRGGTPHTVHYSAAKSGVMSVTRTAATVLAPYKVTSNCINPGIVDTAMWKQLDEEWNEIEGWESGEAWKRRIAPIPLGRAEKAEDVAAVISFLASRDSDYMTGQAVIADGGMIMGN